LGRITNISTSYINAGTVAISTGGEALKLYPGALNTAYMGFYAVSLNSGTRTGNIGYSTAGGVLCITNELSNADINIKTTGAAANIALKPGGYISLEGFTNVTTYASIASAYIGSGPQARFPSPLYSAGSAMSGATVNVPAPYSGLILEGISAMYTAASSDGYVYVYAVLSDGTASTLAWTVGAATAIAAGTWYLSVPAQILSSINNSTGGRWLQYIKYSVFAGTGTTKTSRVGPVNVYGWMF
jgi:hypothetical protein